MKISHARIPALLPLLLTGSFAEASNIVVIDYDAASQDFVRKIDVRGVSGGRLYIQGFLNSQVGVFGLDLTNPLGNTFGTSGRFLGGPYDLAARADGSFVTIAGAKTVTARDPSGAVTMTATLADVGNDVVFQPDGKILVGGAFSPVCLACFTPAAKVTRLNADGSVDTTFASGQIALGHDVAADQLVVLPDGKIAMRGGSYLVLLNGDGTLNTGFGMNSTVQISGVLEAIGTDSQSRIYALSSPRTLKRVLQDGSMDASFNVVGIDPNAVLTGLAVDSTQRVVVFGQIPPVTAGANGIGYIARFTATGALDIAFNGTGAVTVPLPGPMQGPFAGTPSGCVGALQSDDKPVLACNIVGLGTPDVAVARYNADGTADASFGAAIPDFKYYPDPFVFQAASAPYGAAYVTSNPVTLSGTNVNTSINVTGVQGGALSLGCNGKFTDSNVVIPPGQTFCVRGTASSDPQGTATVAVNVGGRVENFIINSTNTAATTTPNAFSFTNQSNVDLSATITSNAVTISGITAFATVTITGDNGFASYSPDCNPAHFTREAGKVGPGQTICVQEIASSTPGVAETATLTVGGVSADFTITTKAAASPPSSSGASGGTGGGGGGGALDLLSLTGLASFSLWAARRRKSLS